jgi:hypothetical protein
MRVGLEQHARQVLPGLVGRHREDRLRDHLAQRPRVDVRQLRLLNARQLGIVAIGHADDLELDLARSDLRPVLLRAPHADLVGRQAFHDLVELPRGHREAALLLDVGRERRQRRDVQVGRAAEDPILALGAQQNVGQDRERAFSIRDSVREIETAQELVLLDLELHH